MSEDMSPCCSSHDEWLIMKLCMYVGYHDANNVSNFVYQTDEQIGTKFGTHFRIYQGMDGHKLN